MVLNEEQHSHPRLLFSLQMAFQGTASKSHQYFFHTNSSQSSSISRSSMLKKKKYFHLIHCNGLVYNISLYFIHKLELLCGTFYDKSLPFPQYHTNYTLNTTLLICTSVSKSKTSFTPIIVANYHAHVFS